MKVTAKMLKKKGACKGQIKVFKEEWPDGVEVTLDNCLRAEELRLDIYWFASTFLTGKCLETYLKAKAPALEAYLKAIITAREAYEKVKTPAEEAYKEKIDTAEEAYKKAIAPALAEAC